MSSDRHWYGVVLVAALVVLLGSMALAAGGLVTHRGATVAGAREGSGFAQGMDLGMMGDGDRSTGDAAVSLAQAQASARDWVAKNAPGATVDDGVTMPMGYVFTVTKDNQVVARMMVNDDTGQIAVSTWATPAPTPSASA